MYIKLHEWFLVWLSIWNSTDLISFQCYKISFHQNIIIELDPEKTTRYPLVRFPLLFQRVIDSLKTFSRHVSVNGFIRSTVSCFCKPQWLISDMEAKISNTVHILWKVSQPVLNSIIQLFFVTGRRSDPVLIRTRTRSVIS